MSKPLIALTPAHNADTGNVYARPACLKAVSAAGAIPVILPLEASDEDYCRLADTFDGFLFTGGPDPHPFLFGEETHSRCGSISVKRDTMELSLLSHVMKRGKPVLGICRGIQIINIGLGGNIYQDIGSQYAGASFPIAHSQPCAYEVPSHTVALSGSGALARICGGTSLRVNSMHHQAVRDLAPGLTACAVSPDGLIEAVEMGKYPWLLAVQWHPEYLWEQDPAAAALFDSFVRACRS